MLNFKHIKGLPSSLFSAFLFLAGIFLFTPQAQADNCGPLHTYWTIGPNASTAYIDLCYVNLNTTDIDDDFSYVPFADPAYDANQDGISGSGIKSGSNIFWGGTADCSTYVRVTTKNCDTAITGDCAWVGIRTAAKVGQDSGSFSSTPIAHIRYPSGTEANVPLLINGGPGGYAYSGCAAPPPTNGVCGADNGQTLSAFPVNLCSAGSPSAVSGTGPWTWTCDGLFGGTTANCSANITPTNGVCGSSDGQTLSTAPTTNLCTTGTATAVAGTGPWTWSCNGSNGGSSDSCLANVVPTPINGTCGPDDGEALNSTPTNLCNTGTATAVAGTGPWTWSCNGSNGGTNDSCSAVLAGSNNGGTQDSGDFCGPLHTYWSIGPNATTPYVDLCYVNLNTTDIDDDFDYIPFADPAYDANQDGISGSGIKSGNNILWGGANDCTSYVRVTTKNCDTNISGDCAWVGIRTAAKVGQDSGSFSVIPTAHIRFPSGTETDVQMLINGGPGGYAYSGCTTPPTNGVCGSSNGQTFASAPNANLCTTGTATAVAGSGPWTWTCNGSNGGTNANCSANLFIAPQYDLAVSVHVDDTTVPPNLHTNPNNPIYTNLTYDITYRNNSAVAMTNIVITENYDETRLQILTAPGATNNGSRLTWNIASLAAGESGVFTYEARLLDSVTSGESVIDGVHIESTTVGMQLANETNQLNNDDAVSVNINEINRSSQRKRVTNLNTGITSTAVHAVEGDVLEYILSYTAGDTDLTGITIVDNDPNFESIFIYANLVDSGIGTFLDANANGRYETATFGPFNIPAYQTQEVRFRVQIKNNLVGLGGDYTLRNSYGNDVTVVTLPNLSFNKFVSVDGAPETQNDSAVPGSILVYRLSVTNTGGSDYNAFIFEDNISDILEYSTITNANGGVVSTNANNQEIIAWVPTIIPAGGTVNRTFTVQVHNPLIAGGDYTLRNVYGNAVTVVTIPNVIISKIVNNANNGQTGLNVSANSGHVLTYTLSAHENIGAANFPNFVFTDNVADILEYADIGNISDNGSLTNNIITWPQVTIPAGGTLTRTFVATIRPSTTWPSGLGYDRTLTNVFGNAVNVTLPGVVYEPDLHIEKTVLAENATNPPSGAAGTDVNYTINYRNEGNLDATVTRIIDNYDEVNLTNLRNFVLPAGVTMVNDGSQITFTIGNLAIGAGGTITYAATIAAAAPHGQDIVNTADILSAEVDNDLSDNQASALVRVASLQVDITKSSNLNSVTNNQIVIYTIVVTNREATPQTVVIRDSISANNGVISGANGGTITFQPGTQTAIFGGNLGLAVGDISTAAGVTLTGIQPNQNATLTYHAISSNAGVAVSTSSNAINTVTLYSNGNPMYSAQNIIAITNPPSGCTVNCGGGGGGGGGGRFPDYKLDVAIQKLISLNGGNYLDANTAADALILQNRKNNLVSYKVIVTNKSSVSILNVQIKDTYSAQNSKISQVAVRNTRGATYQNGIFTLEKIEANSQASFIYQATLNTNSAIQNLSAYNEVEVLKYEPKGNSIQQPKVGQKDVAYVIVTSATPTDTLLRKYSNKDVINDGDEVTYTIIVKNIYNYDLRNVIITDNYDENALEIISAPGLNNGSALEFRRTIIRPGQSIVITYKAKGKNSSQNSIKATNVVKIFSDSADLSNQTAEKTITINPFNAPRQLAQTGSGITLITIISIFGAGLYLRRKKLFA